MTTLRGDLSELEPRERFPGVWVRSFDSERATVNRYEFEPGAEFPRHRHPQEQITIVEEGQVLFYAAGEEHTLLAGNWQIVGPDVPHRVTAGSEGARVTAVLVPRREAKGGLTLEE